MKEKEKENNKMENAGRCGKGVIRVCNVRKKTQHRKHTKPQTHNIIHVVRTDKPILEGIYI